MNRLPSLIVLFFAGAVAAWATPAPCPTGALSLYLGSGFECSSGLLTFSNFAESGSASPPGMEIDPASITVSPYSDSGRDGLQFTSAWQVGTQPGNISSFQDNLITFDVTGGGIFDVRLYFNGSYTGTGLTAVTENYCLNGTLPGCAVGNIGQIKVTNPPASFIDNALNAGTGWMQVSLDIGGTSGIDGTAHISQVISTFSTSAPEPGTFVLLGAGLAAFAGCLAVRRRRG